MRALPHEVAIIVLNKRYDEQQFPSPECAFTREEAWEFLCKLTGQDFGLNYEEWEKWFETNCHTHEQRTALYREYHRKESK